MPTTDTCVTIVPYFKAHEGKLDHAKSLCEQCVTQTEKEEKVLYYGFSFHGDEFHCREGYVDGDGALAHLANIGPLLGQVLENADLVKLELHGPAAELEKLKEPTKDLNPICFTLEYGFRR